jgi:hypothetical protein
VGGLVSLATHDFGRTDCLHLVHPAGCRHNLAHGTDFVGSVARDADVVVALQYELDVPDLELRRFAELAKLARAADDAVDEVICKLQDGL